MNRLMKNKISLASVIGLFKLVEISSLVSFINLESIMKYFLPRLMPNYSKIVPGGIMEDRRLPDHLIGSSKDSFIEDFKIDDFRPKNLEEIEWECLSTLFSILGRSKLLSECLCLLEEEAELNLGGSLIILKFFDYLCYQK